jgi:endonuclease I
MQKTQHILWVGLVISSIFTTNNILAAIPMGYYDSVNTSNAAALRDSLHEIIDDHQRFPYTSSATDTWDILESADEDPNNPSKIIGIYKNESYTKAGGGNSHYNREHTWPKSYGFPNDGASNYPYTDAHHLFLSNSGYNSSRSNKPYAECDVRCSEKVTSSNSNRGGNLGESNWTTGSGASGSWEIWSERKGDSARALMYLAVRYEGDTHSVTGVTEPDLILTDNRALIANSNTGDNLSVAYMGLKSALIQWHKDDPVDDFERRHNEVVYTNQGNRNPFIDHPEYVMCVFKNDCSGSVAVVTVLANVWINELHYDNSGADKSELVELAGNANTNLSGWELVAYNGSNGSVYKTTPLSGTFNNQQNRLGTKSFNINGLQNGSADGIALIDNTGNVVQFISYEGTLTAIDGAAIGLTSTDIGVAETGSTSQGHSLQLSGTGQHYSDFTWQSAASSTAGTLNNNQSF